MQRLPAIFRVAPSHEMASPWEKKRLEMSPSRAIVIGGSGALGRSVIETLSSHSCESINIDYNENPKATHNLVIGDDVQAKDVLAKIRQIAAVDSVICVAGGWIGGDAKSASTFYALPCFSTKKVSLPTQS